VSVNQTAIYILVDISKTPNGSIHPDIQKAIELIYSHLDGLSFKELLKLFAIGIDRNPAPIVKPLKSIEERLEILNWRTNPSAGLDLGRGLFRFIQDVHERSHRKVKTIIFLNERSGTPIYKYIKKLASITDIVEPFMIVACNETAKLHKKNIPDAFWIDINDFMAGWQQILSTWLSNVIVHDQQDVIVNVGFNPVDSLIDIIEKNHFSEIHLFPNEFKGPLNIDRPVTIEGRGATIWVPKGPGVHITSSGVHLRNLRIEVTESPIESNSIEDGCAIKIEPGVQTVLENILVRGTVSGIENEEGSWEYPHTLDLGILPSRVPITGLLRLKVPTNVRVISQVDGLELDTEMVKPGFNEILVNLNEMLPNTLIDGTITLYTQHFIRHIYVRGYVITERQRIVKRPKTKVFWQPNDWELNHTKIKFTDKFVNRIISAFSGK
jgi:hypothetical protein